MNEYINGPYPTSTVCVNPSGQATNSAGAGCSITPLTQQVVINVNDVIRGRVFELNGNQPVFGVQIETCGYGIITTPVGNNGFFEFSVPFQANFCVRVVGGVPARFSKGPFIRPWGDGACLYGTPPGPDPQLLAGGS